MLQLNDDNYFSNDADKEYMSVSQFKSFLPRYGGCEAAALAKINGTYKETDNIALLVGSYFHSHFEGALDKFKEEHPEIFTKQGTLKSQYQQANEMINCLETDKYAMMALNGGEKEKIITFNLFGTPWKAKIDNLQLKDGYFVDLKTTRDFSHRYNEYEGRYINFAEEHGYDIQMAVYRAGIQANFNLNDMDGVIIAVTKQTPPDKAVLSFTEDDYEMALNYVKENLPHILDVKEGRAKSQRCEHCDYCRMTKTLDGAIHYSEL